MSTTNKLSNALRTILYMPSSKTKVLNKSLSSSLNNCDGFIYDLEDAVHINDKELARNNIKEFLINKFINNDNIDNINRVLKQQTIVRINGIETEWFQNDINEIKLIFNEITKKYENDKKILLPSLLIPKIQSDNEINDIKKQLNNDKISISAMIETPLGILNSFKIASVADCLVIGTVDLCNELNCRPDSKDRWTIMNSLQQIVLSAKSYNKPVLDGVYINLDDDDGFKSQCLQGKDLGFDGKTLIHPKQVDICNNIFSPSKDEIEYSNKIIDAYEKGDGGAILVDGKLVELLHIRNAYRILEINNIINGL